MSTCINLTPVNTAKYRFVTKFNLLFEIQILVIFLQVDACMMNNHLKTKTKYKIITNKKIYN